MKRKLIISFIALTAFLSAFGAGASLLVTAPNPAEMEPSVQILQDRSEQTPTAIAGNSWGGFGDGSDDTRDDPPDDEGEEDGNSWGG